MTFLSSIQLFLILLPKSNVSGTSLFYCFSLSLKPYLLFHETPTHSSKCHRYYKDYESHCVEDILTNISFAGRLLCDSSVTSEIPQVGHDFSSYTCFESRHNSVLIQLLKKKETPWREIVLFHHSVLDLNIIVGDQRPSDWFWFQSWKSRPAQC